MFLETGHLFYPLSQHNPVAILGGGFTSRKRAVFLVERKRKAGWTDHTKTAIVFPEAVAAAVGAAQATYHTDARIEGSFYWRGRNSGGFAVMQAEHTLRK